MKYKAREGAVIIKCSQRDRTGGGTSSGVVKQLGKGDTHEETMEIRPKFINEGDVVLFTERDRNVELPDECVMVSPSAVLVVVEEAETDQDRKWLAEARGEDEDDQ
jgi:co-chaperonin GroES (HSP10)